MHSKKQNRVDVERVSDMVFVHCNLWLHAICHRSRDGKCRPILFDEIDVTSEWPTESAESSSPLLDDSWLDMPLECRASP